MSNGCINKPLSLVFKRGDTFNKVCKLTDEDDNGVNLDSYTITSQIRDYAGTLIATLTATKYDQETYVGMYVLSSTDDTSEWPLSKLEMDIQYITNSITTHTETIYISVVRSVTHV